MTYGITLIFIVLSLTMKRNNKIVFIAGLIFLWILFGWSSGNADYSSYIIGYSNYSLSEITEPLFVNLLNFFNLLHFDYQTFLIVISLLIISIYGFFINKTTKNVLFVFLLYFIFPFAIEVVQVRYAVATSIMMIGFYQLIKKDKKERDF